MGMNQAGTQKSVERFVTVWGHLYSNTTLHVLGHRVVVSVVLTLHHSLHLMIARSEMYMKFLVRPIFFDHFGYPNKMIKSLFINILLIDIHLSGCFDHYIACESYLIPTYSCDDLVVKKGCKLSCNLCNGKYQYSYYIFYRIMAFDRNAITSPISMFGF